jgi:hypothetical protein
MPVESWEPIKVISFIICQIPGISKEQIIIHDWEFSRQPSFIYLVYLSYVSRCLGSSWYPKTTPEGYQIVMSDLVQIDVIGKGIKTVEAMKSILATLKSGEAVRILKINNLILVKIPKAFLNASRSERGHRRYILTIAVNSFLRELPMPRSKEIKE